MSVYDFNHNEAEHNDNHTQLGAMNQQSRRFHSNGVSNPTSNDVASTTSRTPMKFTHGRTQYANEQSSNHNPNSSSHINTDQNLSVQLTRPTSKTAMLVRKRRALLELLSCFICKGYLIDATTIYECMDSFCKSCIVLHFRKHKNCPKCGVLVHETNPYGAIRSDKVLQDIVYKMVPGLYDNEMRRRREFYRAIANPSSYPDSDDSASSGSLFNEIYPHLNDEQYGAVPHPKPFYKLTDMIDLSIEPQSRAESSAVYFDDKRQSVVTSFTGNIQDQQQVPLFSKVDGHKFKIFLRCPAKFTAFQLKKFIVAKLNICKDDTVQLLYLNETLKDEYSLIDIAYIYDWRGTDSMRLFYVIERNMTKRSLAEYQQEVEAQKTKTTRHSIGTSTQTVKRVCIDPHPKFYHESRASSSTLSSSERSMRSRSDNNAPKPGTSMSHGPVIKPAQQTIRGPTLIKGSEPKRETRAVARPQRTCTRSDYTESVGANCSQSTQGPRTNTLTMNNLNPISLGSDRGLRTGERVTVTSTAQPISQLVSNANARPLTLHGPNNNVAQIIPFERSNFGAANHRIASVTTQSSIVTLANFTGTTNGQMTTARINTTTTASNAYGLNKDSPQLNVNNTSRPGTSATTQRTTQASSPQLAFSFVTERGITIVRRLQHPDGTPMTSSSVFGNRTFPTPATTTTPSIMPTNSTPRPSTSTNITNTNTIISNSNIVINRSSNVESSSQNTTRFLPGIQRPIIPGSPNQPVTTNQPTPQTSATNRPGFTVRPTGGHSSMGIVAPSTSPSRHLTKVKPVYKTFVDPTKIKSPNLKRLNYTARH